MDEILRYYPDDQLYQQSSCPFDKGFISDLCFDNQPSSIPKELKPNLINTVLSSSYASNILKLPPGRLVF